MDRNTNNILLGIGGSGARCVEAFLHLAACGVGPADAHVCVVDQDAANGNASEALSLLSQLSLLQARLKQEGNHRITDSSPFLRTYISPLNGSGFWSPELPANSRRPYSYFRAESMGPASRSLFDALYSDSEQSIELDEGYHGRPNIGAAVLTSNVLSNDTFLRSLVEKIVEGAGAGRETRIFLVGSIFGGTGAAGFPTIARLISRHPDVVRKKRSIKIGGALLLPYFQFTDSQEDEKVVRAKAAGFLRNAEGALRYYDTIEREGGVYDALYVVGLDPYLTRQNLGRGGKKQINPPMLPELLGALAAVRHFSVEQIDKSEVHISGRAERAEFKWDDLPPPTAFDPTALPQDRAELRQLLGSAIRFAYSYRHIYRPALTPERVSTVKRETWFRNQIRSVGVSIENEAQPVLTALDEYLQRLLQWTAAISVASEVKGSFAVKLFEIGRFADVTSSTGEIRLKEDPRRDDFRKLVVGSIERDLHTVLNELTYAAPASGSQGLGQFVASLHRACRLA
jgi:hypothetical protein